MNFATTAPQVQVRCCTCACSPSRSGSRAAAGGLPEAAWRLLPLPVPQAPEDDAEDVPQELLHWVAGIITISGSRGAAACKRVASKLCLMGFEHPRDCSRMNARLIKELQDAGVVPAIYWDAVHQAMLAGGATAE